MDDADLGQKVGNHNMRPTLLQMIGYCADHALQLLPEDVLTHLLTQHPHDLCVSIENFLCMASFVIGVTFATFARPTLSWHSLPGTSSC